MKEWLDESNEGVVYFTFGSMALVESIEEKILKSFYASFEKIAPVKILAKVVNVTKLPSVLPKNVKTLPWIPQQPVLGIQFNKILICIYRNFSLILYFFSS